MAMKRVEELLGRQSFQYEICDFDRDFEDTEDARQLLGIPSERIAKTLVFRAPIGATVILLAGDAMVDAKKYEKKFRVKRFMLDEEELMEYTGCVPGSVTPLALPNKRAKVYMDISLRRFETEYVYPSGGTANSALAITAGDLFAVSGCREWIDVCTGWQSENTEEDKGEDSKWGR